MNYPAFAPAEIVSVGGYPMAVAVADVKGDGRPDLLFSYNPGTVQVLLNTTAPGATGVMFFSEAPFALGSKPTLAAAADMNGDGRHDVVVSDWGDENVKVMLNRPAVAGNPSATVTIDSAPVLQSFQLPGFPATNASTVYFTVIFSEPITGLTAANFTLTGTAASGAVVGPPTTADGVTWVVPVTTAGEGTLGLALSNRAGITDGAGNPLYSSTVDNGMIFPRSPGRSTSWTRRAPAPPPSR